MNINWFMNLKNSRNNMFIYNVLKGLNFYYGYAPILAYSPIFMKCMYWNQGTYQFDLSSIYRMFQLNLVHWPFNITLLSCMSSGFLNNLMLVSCTGRDYATGHSPIIVVKRPPCLFFYVMTAIFHKQSRRQLAYVFISGQDVLSEKVKH